MRIRSLLKWSFFNDSLAGTLSTHDDMKWASFFGLGISYYQIELGNCMSNLQNPLTELKKFSLVPCFNLYKICEFYKVICHKDSIKDVILLTVYDWSGYNVCFRVQGFVVQLKFNSLPIYLKEYWNILWKWAHQIL